MKKYFLSLLLLTILQGCVERNNVTEDNSSPIYKRERVFSFLSSHLNSDGLVTQQDTLILRTSSKTFNEEYGQTKSSWELKAKGGWREHPGIAEHDTAIWIHPPRSGAYSKLELSPFPMVQYPIEVGHEWNWNLLVGSHYSVKGYAEWGDTPEQFLSTYSITREVAIPTKIGLMNCFEIEGFTDSRFGRTELKSFFNKKHGFVRLEYLNIDKGRITIELIEEKDVHPTLGVPFKGIENNLN